MCKWMAFSPTYHSECLQRSGDVGAGGAGAGGSASTGNVNGGSNTGSVGGDGTGGTGVDNSHTGGYGPLRHLLNSRKKAPVRQVCP